MGALIGHALTEDKTEDKEGSAFERISRLLSTGILDWAVTDKEAHAALDLSNVDNYDHARPAGSV